jgi:hypothetical protein
MFALGGRRVPRQTQPPINVSVMSGKCFGDSIALSMFMQQLVFGSDQMLDGE